MRVRVHFLAGDPEEYNAPAADFPSVAPLVKERHGKDRPMQKVEEVNGAAADSPELGEQPRPRQKRAQRTKGAKRGK